jgi:hypothetical protein
MGATVESHRASQSFAAGGEWKIHMSLCYSSAKSLCRLQEATLQRFGLSGSHGMFNAYQVKHCTSQDTINGKIDASLHEK